MPDVVDQVGARPSAHSVEQVAHVFGEIAPDRALAPHPGLARDDCQQCRRFHDGAWLVAPYAFQRHDMLAVRGAQLDVQGPDPGPEAHGTPSRTGEIPVAIDQDRAGTVRLHAPPVACVERRARQREHMIQIGLEQIPDRHGLAVVLPACDLVALVQPRPRQRVPPLGRRFGHHQVAIARTRPRSRRCPSRGPHTGRGHLVPAPVMRAEQGEQAGLRDRAVRVAMADARGVVEHQRPGHHAHASEDLQQPVAHALRGLPGQRGHVPHVRVRE